MGVAGSDGDGAISKSEFLYLMKKIFKTIVDEQSLTLFRAIDSDHDQTLAKDEFVSFCTNYPEYVQLAHLLQYGPSHKIPLSITQ